MAQHIDSAHHWPDALDFGSQQVGVQCRNCVARSWFVRRHAEQSWLFYQVLEGRRSAVR